MRTNSAEDTGINHGLQVRKNGLMLLDENGKPKKYNFREIVPPKAADLIPAPNLQSMLSDDTVRFITDTEARLSALEAKVEALTNARPRRNSTARKESE